MRVLVTGATGFVGRHLVPRLAQRHDLWALTRSGAPADLGDLAEWVATDLSAPLSECRLPDRLDAVIHLAQSARYRELPEGAEDVFAVNVAATFGLLEHARSAGASRFVLASTGGIYRPGPQPLDERAPLAPAGLYLASKAAAERLLLGYGSDMNTIALRPFFIYGPRQEGMLISNLAHRVLRHEPVELQGNPGLRTSPVYVDDAARAFEAALGVEGHETVNVAGGEAVTLTELVRTLGEESGVTPEIRHLDGPTGEDLVADTRRMTDVLGVKPTVSLREGLARVVAESTAGHRQSPG